MKHYVRVNPNYIDTNGAEIIIDSWLEGQRTPGADDRIIGETKRKQGHLLYYAINYKKREMAWDPVTEAVVVLDRTIQQRRKIRKKQLKKFYLQDVLWTDDTRVFYRKLVDTARNIQADDNWYGDIKTFWGESWDARKQNKTDCDNAADQAALDAIDYSVTHVKTREEIE